MSGNDVFGTWIGMGLAVESTHRSHQCARHEADKGNKASYGSKLMRTTGACWSRKLQVQRYSQQNTGCHSMSAENFRG